MFSKTTISLLLAALAPADAFWRMSCSIVQTGRVDPLVSPGKVAGHVHKIAGGSSQWPALCACFVGLVLTVI